MTTHKTPDAELQVTRSDLRDAQAAAIPRLANLDAISPVHDDGVLTFRSRRFRVPPVSGEAGLRILVLDRHLAGLFRQLKRLMQDEQRPATDPAVREVGIEVPATYLALAAEYFGCCRPLTWFDRLFWRFRDNPFVNATEQEVRDLAGFFSGARMRSTVRWRSSSRAPSYLRTTWPVSGPPSRPRIRPGLSMVPPVAGGTTGSDSPR